MGQYAADNDKPFAFNLSAVFLILFELEALKKALPFADYIFANEDECSAYAKTLSLEESDRVGTAKALCLSEKANKKRARTVVITQGCEPTIVVRSSLDSEDLSVEMVEVDKIEKDLVVDTNGAGDSFVGGFLHALSEGKEIVDCVKAGNKLAGIVVQKNGCQFE